MNAKPGTVGGRIDMLRRINPTHNEAILALLRYEQELEKAADIIQKTIPIGRVKGIGLLEVAAGCREMAREIEELRSQAVGAR